MNRRRLLCTRSGLTRRAAETTTSARKREETTHPELDGDRPDKIGLYAINPETRRSKWIDDDYADALKHLCQLQWIQTANVEAELETGVELTCGSWPDRLCWRVSAGCGLRAFLQPNL